MAAQEALSRSETISYEVEPFISDIYSPAVPVAGHGTGRRP